MWSKDDTMAVIAGTCGGCGTGTVVALAGAGMIASNVVTAITAVVFTLGWYVVRG